MSQIVCKECQSNRLTIQDDRTKPIGYASMVPIYAKKYTCKDCKFSWTQD